MLKHLKNTFGRMKRETVQPPPPEAVRAKPLPMVGLFGLLTEEQKRRALSYEGSESFGSDEFKRRIHA